MKIWISDKQTSTHRLVKLNCSEHSDFKYYGDLDDEQLVELLFEVQESIDIDKNIKLIKYYGYLNIFVIKKS